MRSSPWLRFSTTAIAVVAINLASIGVAHAADKDCMAAASDGQEVRDQGHLVEARAYFQKCAQSECPAPIPTFCGDWLVDVGRKIPTLVVRVVDDKGQDVTDASVVLDERTVGLDGRAVEVDPGRHHIRISRPGSKAFETEIIAAQGEKDRIIVAKLIAEELPATLPPLPPARPEPSARGRVPAASLIAWSIGAAGLFSFSVFGIKARLDYDSYESSCGQRCTISDRDSVATTVSIADASLVVGLLGAGVGTALFLMQPKVTAETRSTAVTGGAR
jgi:hypothetical protein